MKDVLPVLGSLLVIVGAPAAHAQTAHAQDARRPKKLIATGWDQPNPERLLGNLDLMEKRPFDGVVIEVVGTRDDGNSCAFRRAFADEPWQRAWFAAPVDRLKACRFQRFTDNFVLLGANPGNVDWFDDAGWKNIIEHWRIAAQVARQSAVRGILFDPEAYTPPFAQFRYAAQAEHDRHTFDEYCAKARERGREVIGAVAGEFPDVTLFSYFMNSVVARATGRADPSGVLSTKTYGLLPAFIDGWLDAATPEMVFVDGCEMAYLYNSRREYLEAAVRIKGACQELVSPENRAKYRAQVQVGFGVYMDAYWNPKDSEWGQWYIDGRGGPRVERLRENVGDALEMADQYVWIYGEKFRWWPAPGPADRKTWPEGLPGCEEMLGYARDPVGFARFDDVELYRLP